MIYKTIIIAEAGVNHNGDLKIAKGLIEKAAKAGADYIKFQTFKADLIVANNTSLAEYQKVESNVAKSQLELLKELEIPEFWYQELLLCCKENKIKFLSTGFDNMSIDLLCNLGVDFLKVPSGEITNKPLLKHIASKNKNVVISSGMANILEIQNAIDIFIDNGIKKENITILHCNTEYPTPMKDVNLLSMLYIKKQLGVEVGYSDHTLGIEVPIAAVSLGAKIIEKHFTIDKKMKGPDHRASLEPFELESMITSIRNIELVLQGQNEKKPSSSEMKNVSSVRRSIHSSRKLFKGHKIELGDLISLRPGTGISPMQIEEIIGKELKKDIEERSIINFEDIF